MSKTHGDRPALLSKLTTAGINGQFRTPRHIIRMMVEVTQPEPTWTVSDPACGTGGFLVAVREYLRQKYTSEEGKIVEKNEDGEPTPSSTKPTPSAANARRQ